MGFAGTALLVFTGRGEAFIWLFVILKTWLEIVAIVQRSFGWKGSTARE